MKALYSILFSALFLVGCKSDKKKEIKPENLSIPQKIANAHGFENWKNVNEVQFTFVVNRDTIKGYARKWTWFPKTDSVYMKTGIQNTKYSRRHLDSISKNADRAFINDKYWAFVPFQLIWDNTATISDVKKAKTPISKTEMDMITILYPAKGGYTPGDAYDIYFDENYMIREWSFRKLNATKPMLSNTFENYKDYNGIKIATDHKKDNGNWNLSLTNISVKTD